MNHIKITQSRGVRTIALNRPEKRNAFFPPMIVEITKAFREAGKEKSVRAVLLTGEGASFCAGGDLEWMKSTVDFTLKRNVRDAEDLFEMFWAIRSTPVPVVGRIFGHAFGGGAGLAAVCDLVAAESGTSFCFSEVKWGLVPAVISPFVVERAAPSKVREWFLTAKVFDAKEAMEAGLAQFVGTRSELDAYLEQRLGEIAAAGPEAVRATKALHQSYSGINWKSARSKVVKLIASRRVSVEGQTGLKAFLEKKTPAYGRFSPWPEAERE